MEGHKGTTVAHRIGAGPQEKYRPHRPQLPSRSRNACKTSHFYAIDKRVVIVRTVDDLPSAGDSRIEYRPQESPANHYIHGNAGGAGGTLRCSSGKTSAIAFYAGQSHRLEVLKGASNAFGAEEQALGGVGPNGMLRGFKIACTRIEGRPTGSLVADRGSNLLLPLPRHLGIRVEGANGPTNART